VNMIYIPTFSFNLSIYVKYTTIKRLLFLTEIVTRLYSYKSGYCT